MFKLLAQIVGEAKSNEFQVKFAEYLRTNTKAEKVVAQRPAIAIIV